MAEERERWIGGEEYERYVGRWSRPVAREFVRWLEVSPASRWLDVGCGTGALAATILAEANPAMVRGIDPSEGFIAHARRQVADERAQFGTGDARWIEAEDGAFDAVVSGLVLNFVPDIPLALREMARVTRAGGTVAVYVWDYAGEMQMMRHFWDAARELAPAAQAVDEGERFPICRPEALEAAFREAKLLDVEALPIVVSTRFRDFDDYWQPFLSGNAPAPAYAMSLAPADRDALRERLRARLRAEADGTIALTARAWAARGRKVE